MRKTALGIILVLLIVAGVVAWLTMFTVSQTQQALVLQFGNPVRIITEPGLHFKIPFIQNVIRFDRRLLDLDTAPQELIAADQKRLVVDAFARYRILNPLLFYQTVNNEAMARSQLSAILEAALRRVIGASSFDAVVSDQREELMKLITAQVNEEAKGYGVEVVDVRIKRADLPEANSLAIYRRMQTERQQEAAQIRARGEEAARRIRANADRQVVVIKADATQKAETLRGEGDAERNSIFADAFGQDPEFFEFYRAMQAYETGLNPDDTRLVLSPDSVFFRYFTDPTPMAKAESAPTPNVPVDPDGDAGANADPDVSLRQDGAASDTDAQAKAAPPAPSLEEDGRNESPAQTPPPADTGGSAASPQPDAPTP